MDRRRAPRRAVPGVDGTLRSPGDVKILELSVTGLSAELGGELQPGDHCFLELRHRGSRATVEAIVKWSGLPRIERDPARPPLVFRAGMAFVDVEHDGADLLWQCIVPDAAR
jgi:hypothetical protein